MCPLHAAGRRRLGAKGAGSWEPMVREALGCHGVLPLPLQNPLRTTFKTMVETITFVGICRGIDSFQGFLDGVGFRPSTVPSLFGGVRLWG